MYNAVRSTNSGSIIYFLSLIIFGNIILLQLFLAVLLENFEEKRKEIEKEKIVETKMNLSDLIKEAFKKILKYLFNHKN